MQAETKHFGQKQTKVAPKVLAEMYTAVTNLLKAEKEEWERNPIPGFVAEPTENEDGTKNWMSNIFHPNIGSTRYLQIPRLVLEPKFLAPKMDIRMILLAIQHILQYPDLALRARANAAAFDLFLTNRLCYNDRIARQAHRLR
ncbi:uncharacterized protein LOC111068632 [Drosophila obscura]|uniref:uncharacterized protein LOC111068632 n=1 Tax=Drosophila obscura TaxID=7282 RepID=UPI000BA1909E|nr:uncharacterized protein LOC111068632 [Drosophila obscura]